MVDGVNAGGIQGPGGLVPKLPGSQTAKPGEAGGASFSDFLSQSMRGVDKMQHDADDMVGKLMTGEIQDVTQVLNAVQKADMSFQMMMEIRNKLVDAYEEILRMRV